MSVKMEVLGEKPTGCLFRDGFLVGSVLEESAGVSKPNVQRNKHGFLLPRARFWEVHTSSLKRRKASLWMC